MPVRKQRKEPLLPPPSNQRFELPQIYQPEESQIGLQQIGNLPFFITPNDPADPRDCNRYPNSPWCGENPINLDSIANINVDLVFDNCNIGVQFTPTLGFISLPPVQLVYRRQECINTPPPPLIKPDEFIEQLPAIRGNINNKESFIGFISRWYRYEDIPGESEVEVTANFVKFERGAYINRRIAGKQTDAKLTLFVNSKVFRTGQAVYAQVNGNASAVQTSADLWIKKGGVISGNSLELTSRWTHEASGEITLYFILGGSAVNADIPENLRATGINGDEFLTFLYRTAGLRGILVRRGAQVEPNSGFPLDYHELNRLPLNFRITRNPENYPIDISSKYESRQDFIVDTGSDFLGTYYILNQGYAIRAEALQTYWFEPGWKPTIPPPEIYKMDCCENNDRLLRLLLQRVGNFPVTVPNSYLTIEDSEPPDKQINSLMEFTAWFASRMDEVIGQFEIKVEIDDADLTEEGKQKKVIRLPNLAETVAELFTMTFQQTIYTDLIIHLLTNTLAEAGQNKQMGLKNNQALMAIAEYMGFPYKNVSQKMPLTFTPGSKTFEELLKTTEIDVSCIDYVQKSSMTQDLETLKQAAAIIRAVFYRRAPKDDEALKQQLREDLIGLSGGNVGNLRENIEKYIKDLGKKYDGSESSDTP